MKLHIEFFGPIQDRVGHSAIDLEAGTLPSDRTALIALLSDRINGGAALGDPHIQLAINDALVPEGQAFDLADGDRIAFLSPFSGG